MIDDDIYEGTRRRLLKHLADANEAHMRAIQPLLSALERLEGVRHRPEPVLIPAKVWDVVEKINAEWKR